MVGDSDNIVSVPSFTRPSSLNTSTVPELTKSDTTPLDTTFI